MKKNKILCFLICCVLVFCIFAGCEQAEESKTDISDSDISETSKEVSPEISDEISEVSEEEPFVIVDKRRGSDWSTSIDCFFEDEEYLYYFGLSPMHQYIIVEYADGTTQNVKEALADGNITIEDLDRFGIGYMKEPKDVSN